MPNINPGEPAYHAHVEKEEGSPRTPRSDKAQVNEAKLSAYDEHQSQEMAQV